MPKQNKNGKRAPEVDEWAHEMVALSTQDSDSIPLPTAAQVSKLMSELGRKGGKIGGKRRLQTMTKKERADVARKAARARWKAK